MLKLFLWRSIPTKTFIYLGIGIKAKTHRFVFTYAPSLWDSSVAKYSVCIDYWHSLPIVNCKNIRGGTENRVP